MSCCQYQLTWQFQTQMETTTRNGPKKFDGMTMRGDAERTSSSQFQHRGPGKFRDSKGRKALRNQ
eukprot:5785239-Amphidinium_carterae.1